MNTRIDAHRVRGANYQTVWRWHFFAGLIVLPYLLLASLSGLLMLLSKPLDAYVQSDLTSVTAMPVSLSLEQQTEVVSTQFSGHVIKHIQPPASATASTAFAIVPNHGGHQQGGHNAGGLLVYINPYTGDVLGAFDPTHSYYNRIKTMHSTLYLGAVGEIFVEVAAGLSIVMLLSGLFLGWSKPRPDAVSPDAKPSAWRRSHRWAGTAVALPMLVLLLSGLSWTGVWGGKLVQPWGSLPGTRFEGEAVTADHSTMNQVGGLQMPWAVEQAPLPSAAHSGGKFWSADAVAAQAEKLGFERFRLHPPGPQHEVWTVSATTIAGDIRRPGNERIVHLHPETGEILADIAYADYPTMGKAMAAFVPLHQGDLGGWNILLNAVICIAVLFMVVSGTGLWVKRSWRQRPRFSAPAQGKGGNAAFLSLLAVSLLFPLSAVLLMVAALLMLGRKGIRIERDESP